MDVGTSEVVARYTNMAADHESWMRHKRCPRKSDCINPSNIEDSLKSCRHTNLKIVECFRRDLDIKMDPSADMKLPATKSTRFG